jgi:hypothetical protein
VSASLAEQIAIAAAQLVVDEGLEYATAKRKAARQVAGGKLRGSMLPRNEAIEEQVRAHLATFHADTQPGELAALRRLAMRWLERLAAHHPYLGGAVWRGTATRISAIIIDLYCDDPKTAEIDLINLGLDFDVGGDGDAEPGSVSVLTVGSWSDELKEQVTVHLVLHDLDDLRGALKPDAQGRTWRGDLPALRRLMAGPPA